MIIAASKDVNFQQRLEDNGALLIVSPFIKGACYVKNNLK
jgi:hypothetical protein